MKKEKPMVHCIYAQSGKPVAALLEDAFRAYLFGMLQMKDGK